MPERKASARWDGDLKGGQGSLRLGSGAFEGKYSFGTRFEQSPGTNPEELLGAAEAACFSMALAAKLGKEGYQPASVETNATVHLEKVGDGMSITRMDLETTGKVPNISAADFARFAEDTRKNCIVSRALAGIEIRVNASLA